MGRGTGPPERSSRALQRGRGGPARAFEGVTLLREDGTATYHLASVVDDIDFGITHVIRGNDHRPNEALHRALAQALGARSPEYVHHGLILGADGKKISKRAAGGSIASLREPGIPAEAVRATSTSSGCPRHDVHLDLGRIRSLVGGRDRVDAGRRARRASGVPAEVARRCAVRTT